MKTILMNLYERPDRLALARQELRRAHIPHLVSQRHKHPDSGRIGAKEHVLELLEAFPGEDLWLIEDDIQLDPDFTELYHAIQLPSHWELLYFGGSLRINADGKAYAHQVVPGLIRTYGTLHTHCVLIRHTIVPLLLQELPKTNNHWDVDLIRTIQPRGKSYMCYPVLARQRPDYSDIQEKTTAYRDFYLLQDTQHA